MYGVLWRVYSSVNFGSHHRPTRICNSGRQGGCGCWGWLGLVHRGSQKR